MSLYRYLPELTLFLTAVVSLFAGLGGNRKRARFVTIIGAAAALLICLAPAFGCTFFRLGSGLTGPAAPAFRILAIGGLLLVVSAFRERADGPAAELYPLFCLSGLGASLAVGSSDVITLFIGIELASLPAYAMAAMGDGLDSLEAGIKYFVTGIAASAILLYGLVILCGLSGSISLDWDAAISIGAEYQPAALFAIALIIAGLGLKMALAPFHFWAPDVYGGAPTSVTAFLATVPKIAAVGILVGILDGPLAPAFSRWAPLLWIISVLAMVWGNLAAMRQDDLKRMMAYSSIAHTGYMIAGLAAGGREALEPLALYGFVYTLMTVGVFVVIENIAGPGAAPADKLHGLSARRPLLAFAFAVCLFSLIGLPPLGGFMAKLNIMMMTVRHGQAGLAALIVLNSALAAFYYLNALRRAYGDCQAPAEVAEVRPVGLGLPVAVAGVLVAGIAPTLILRLLGF